MDVTDAVNDVRAKAFRELLVAKDLTLSVVLEVAVAFEATLNDLAELGSEELEVEEMVYA